MAGASADRDGGKPKREMPRKYFLGLIFLMVVVSSVVISFNGESHANFPKVRDSLLVFTALL